MSCDAVSIRSFSLEKERKEFLDSGSFGNVYYLPRRKMVAKHYADPFDDEYLTIIREIAALQVLHHPNIISLMGYLINRDSDEAVIRVSFAEIVVLLEPGIGSLSKWCLETPQEVKQNAIPVIMYQLLRGVAYLHDEGFFHRDLKPDNIIISRMVKSLSSLRLGAPPSKLHVNEIPHIKLIDFGSAKLMFSKNDNRHIYSSYVTTKWYRAPEIIAAHLPRRYRISTPYTAAADIWSIGAIFFELLTGKILFSAEEVFDIAAMIGELYQGDTFAPKILQDLKGIGVETLDLLRRLLTIEPEDRITAREALNHSYFQYADIKRLQRLIPEEKRGGQSPREKRGGRSPRAKRGSGLLKQLSSKRADRSVIGRMALKHKGNHGTAVLADSLYRRTRGMKIGRGQRFYVCLRLAFELTTPQEERVSLSNLLETNISDRIGPLENDEYTNDLLALVEYLSFDIYG
jgi:serine/threonine protein kinase